MVGEDLALDVVILVLDDAGDAAAEGLLFLFQILRQVGDFDGGRAIDVLMDVGETEAALVERVLLAEPLGNDGVDES